MYYEVAIGSVYDRSHIVDEKKIKEYIHQARVTKQQLYHSVWLYPEEIIDHFNTYRTVKSYHGEAFLRHIVFDIDKGKGKGDTDQHVLERARAFIRKLKDEWEVSEDALKVYYSGRGYHIYMPNFFRFEQGKAIFQEVKNTMKEYFPEVDLSIYEVNRLLRAPYSLNQKSGLFKVPFTMEEIFCLEASDVMRIASSNSLRKMEYNEDYIDRDFSNRIIKANALREDIRFKEEPTRIITCMQKLFERGSQDKNRHIELMRLVSAWRVQGLSNKACFTLAKEWCSSLTEYELKRVVDSVFEAGYRYGCNDFIMSKFCDPKCVKFVNKNFNVGSVSTNDVEEMLIKSIYEKQTTGYIELQDLFQIDHSYKIYKGEMVTFFGDTKLGKSAMVQTIVVESKNVKWLVWSGENGLVLDSRRYAQIAKNMTKQEIEDFVLNGSKGLLDELPNIQWSEATLNLEELRKIIIQTQVDFVVIDTVDQLSVPKSSGYTDKTEALAMGIRDIARTTKVGIILIHHISKSASQDEKGNLRRMTIHSGKGSSALEQKSDKVISIEGERDNEIRIIKSLGARDEAPFEKTMRFNKETMRFYPIGERN